MFEFLFKYPIPVFVKGKLVLLGSWPAWALVASAGIVTAVLGMLLWTRLQTLEPTKDISETTQRRRAAAIWTLQSLLAAALLILLWRPAMVVAELKSNQNIIAILVDDSRSMAIADSGGDGTQQRETAAVAALKNGILAGLQARFQTRIYRLDGSIRPVEKLKDLLPDASSTHISTGLRKLTAETSELPVGAVILLTDGADNGAGMDLETMNMLRNRQLPVHTIGFGLTHTARDIELQDVSIPTRAMAASRMRATVSLSQHGFAGIRTTLQAKDGEKVLASREVVLAADGVVQDETMFFNAGDPGIKRLTVSVAPLAQEENLKNNALTRLVSVNGAKRRILYVEGEPRWEYKFIRRAADDDKQLQIVSMLRTTENKIYRQGIGDPSELANGFPNDAEDLFRYDGIIIGSVEAGYFSPRQQELLREYVDQRGGGLLFLGGRFALADGGWSTSGDNELLPTFLPVGKGTFHRDPATAELTAAGADSPVLRLVDDPLKNVERWKHLPYMMDFQDAGNPKPGATVLANLVSGHARLPLLITQDYGRGRTAILATSGTWRWQMSGTLGDPTHDLFWQQLLRWVVADSPGNVLTIFPQAPLMDEGHVALLASVRDKAYRAAPDANVTARILGPEGATTLIEMTPVQTEPGTFAAEWSADKAGSYVAEITARRAQGELGSDVVSFQRENGVAENFHTAQNRELLQKLSAETGGKYWEAAELGKLSSEISYSEAGISVKNTKELWNMPICFILIALVVSWEWILRRKWGMI